MPPNEVTTENEIQGDPVFQQRGFIADTSDNPEPEGLSAEDADAAATAIQAGGAPDMSATEGEEEAPAPEAAKKAAKIKIGTREFETSEEAWTYAQELEQEKIAADAFRQGIEAASAQAQSNLPPEPQKEEALDPEYYTDPQSYWRKREARLAAEIKAQVNSELTMKERNAKTWSDFYSNYPDLAKAQPLVQIVLNQDWETLKHIETSKALKIIAEKTRQMKRDILADELPGRELPAVKQAASAGKGAGVTPKQNEEQALNFTQQMRSMRNKRTQRMRR